MASQGSTVRIRHGPRDSLAVSWDRDIALRGGPEITDKITAARAASSNGRATPLHGEGSRFESGAVHASHRVVAQLGSAYGSGP